MAAVSEPERGRRAERKRVTRAALHRAALEIAHDEGVAAATVERVAERAGVSPRTFFNYFATKDDALSGVDPDLPAALAQALRERPQDEPLRDSLRAVLVERMATATREPQMWRMRAVVARESPSISVAVLGAGAQTARALADAAYAREGVDPADDIAPAVAVFTALGAVRAAIWTYGQRGFEGEIEPLVRECFEISGL